MPASNAEPTTWVFTKRLGFGRVAQLNGSRLVGMKRQLDLHGNVVASFCPTTMDALTVSRRGAHREASCQMDTIGLDLHKRESQLCIGHADGTIIERHIVTSRERFTAVLGHRPRFFFNDAASTE